MTYLPYIITTQDKAESFLNGEIQFYPIVPDEFKSIPNHYTLDYLKRGTKQQLKDGAIVDLSDFSSTALTLFTCEPDERMRRYGDTVIVITKPRILFERLNTVNDRMYPNLKYLFASDVICDDGLFEENIRNQVLNPFIHRSADAWKQEVMILSRVKPSIILTDVTNGDIFIIPDGICDIAVVMNINEAIKGGLAEYQHGTVEDVYPMLTDIEISVSCNIQDIKPENGWIDKLKTDICDDWQPITRVITSPDGKSEVPCLGFTDGANAIVFQVNTIRFNFARSSNDRPWYNLKFIDIVEKVIRRAGEVCDTSFCNPSIILTSDMGELTGDFIRNKEFELRKTVDDRGLIHWYLLSINNLVRPGIFGVPQAGRNHWMFKEQIMSLDNILWYDANRILAFYKQAYEEIWTHMNRLSPEDIVYKIINIGGEIR